LSPSLLPTLRQAACAIGSSFASLLDNNRGYALLLLTRGSRSSLSCVMYPAFTPGSEWFIKRWIAPLLIPGKVRAAFTRKGRWNCRLQDPSPRLFWRLPRKAPLCKTIGSRNRNDGNRTLTASLDGEIRDGRHQMQSASILKIRTPAKLFITRIFCASWNAAEQITYAFSGPISTRCSKKRGTMRPASPSLYVR